MSYDFPLNDDACAAADERFYAMNPGPPMHDADGNRISLGAQNSDNHDLHELWHDLYHEELAKLEGGGAPDEDDGDSGEYPEAPEDAEDFPDIQPGGGSCPLHEISLQLEHYELLPINVTNKAECLGINYRARLTNSTQEATSGHSENRWSDMPPGNCEFSMFDFHEPGMTADLPDFEL